MAKINKDLFGDIAHDLQKNMEDEAEAIKSYQELLNILGNMLKHEYIFTVYDNGTQTSGPSPTARADKKMIELIIDNVKNIIGDELDHQKKLTVLYSAVTGLTAKE